MIITFDLLSSAPEITFDLSRQQPIEFDYNISVVVSGEGIPYKGEYVVIPKAYSETVLETDGYTMHDDVTVTKIPYYETGNEYGDTVYIADEVI